MKTFHIHHRITKRDSALDKYFQQVERIPRLSRHQEEEIYKRLPSKEARDKLVRHNLRFAISVAKGYNIPGTELLDLIQECNIGLSIAAEKFDPTRGVRFISYAVWYCQIQVMKHIKAHKLVTVPEDIMKALRKLRTFVESETPMFDDELCSYLRITESDLRRVRQGTFEVMSIDAPVYDDDDGGFHIHDAPDLSAENKEHKYRCLNAAMKSLDDREKYVIEQYFGLNGNYPQTYLEIGKTLGCSRELVRQIRDKAEKKMRAVLRKVNIFA